MARARFSSARPGARFHTRGQSPPHLGSQPPPRERPPATDWGPCLTPVQSQASGPGRALPRPGPTCRPGNPWSLPQAGGPSSGAMEPGPGAPGSSAERPEAGPEVSAPEGPAPTASPSWEAAGDSPPSSPSPSGLSSRPPTSSLGVGRSRLRQAGWGGMAASALLEAGLARVLFYPTLLYTVFRGKVPGRAHRDWYHRIDPTVVLGALPLRSMTRRVSRGGGAGPGGPAAAGLGAGESRPRLGGPF